MTISKFDDIIDSRDLMERIEELEDEIDNLDDEEKEGLELLKKFASEFEGYAPDFAYGEVAIRDSYFKQYAMDLAEDIGAIDRNSSWPNTCIDWEQAARELQMDYSGIEFEGVTYWVR